MYRFPVEKQVLIIYAATNGYLDDYPTDVLVRYEEEFDSFVESKHQALLTEIREKKKMDESIEAKLKSALEEFNGLFVVDAKVTLFRLLCKKSLESIIERCQV